ncbi:MAG: hypothetical protein EOP06_01210 [Proteobacteria bacterium]|nr:MAG: hypothetical protein EOP06_01210 [Pseudomonadota bacterium]
MASKFSNLTLATSFLTVALIGVQLGDIARDRVPSSEPQTSLNAASSTKEVEGKSEPVEYSSNFDTTISSNQSQPFATQPHPTSDTNDVVETPTALASPSLSDHRASGLGSTGPHHSYGFKQPEFWIWLGVGMNYQFYEQALPSIGGVGTFQNIQGPVQSIRAGFQGHAFGLDTSYRKTPGRMDSKASTTVVGGQYTWETLESEALYRLGNEWGLRAGVQYHSLPYMDFYPSTQTVFVRSNSILMATVGFDRKFPISERLRGDWQMRYQLPVLSGSSNGDSFDVRQRVSFDGSVGAVYSVTKTFRTAVYWYGQYHTYDFTYETPDKISRGSQTLIYSSVELKFGLEF